MSGVIDCIDNKKKECNIYEFKCVKDLKNEYYI